ncbi:MAG TPA: ComEC/Rec2 family competence protein [Rhizobiaceae bacterium]|nr:ComEC/Rec2 family competence protein [Rhizobiaceae bacterium]
MAKGNFGGEISERLQFGADELAVADDVRLYGLPAEALNSSPPALTAVEKLGDSERAQSKAALVQPSRAWPDKVRTALTTEWERGTAFHFIPVLQAAGALTYFALPGEPGFSPLLLGAALVAALTFVTRGWLAFHLGFAATLCILLGVIFAKVETWRADTKVLGSEISTRLTGRVAAVEHLANGRVRLTLDVVKTERPALRYAPERVRVSAREVPASLKAGALVAGVVRLMPPSGPLRPNGYDFSFESYFDGTGANGFYLRNPELVAETISPDFTEGLSAWIENTRLTLAGRIESHIRGAEGEIAAALVAGVRAGIPEDVNEALRKTGLAHVLSISGLHMALVSLTIMVLIRSGFALLPAFSSRHAVKKYAASVALIALAVYLFISGSAVAAERSFIMIAVMLAALLVDRSALTMRNLAIAAIVILVISPHEAAGPSFQMSFAATAALIGAYAAWSERKAAARAPANDHGVVRRAIGTGGRYFGELAATSIIAGAATALYGVYHFQRVATLGLVANLAAMPVVSLVVMPFAVLGMIFMPFGLDGPFFAVMGEGLNWMIAIAEWFAARSPIDAVGMIPPSAVLVLTVALVIATLLTTWLRVIAVPIALLGIALLATRPMPDLLIAEDGRLVGLRTGDGVAVNRSRPNAFTAENWQMALNSTALIKPMKLATSEVRIDALAGQSFVCGEGLCVARHDAGALVVHAETAELAWPYCSAAALIVIDDATASTDTCATSNATVITKRELAQWGSASVTLSDGVAVVVYSVGRDYRPWHTHRAFSREARGLAPYQRKTDTAPAEAQ